MRAHLLFAAAIVSATAAHATEPQATVMVNTTTGAVVEKEALPLKGFMQRISPPSKAPQARAAPIAIAPPEVAAASPPRRRTPAGQIPLPRLAPDDDTNVAAVTQVLPPSPPQGMKTLTAEVTYETTGSVAAEPAAPADAAASPVAPLAPAAAAPATEDAPRVVGPTPPPPAAAPAVSPPPAGLAPTPVQMLAAGGDDLLGDPTDSFPHGPNEMAPVVVKPASIVPRRGASGGVAPAVASDRPLSQPYQLLRTLQSLQDELAAGSTDAVAAQRALRGEIERTFTASPPSVWQDRKNAEAAVTYVLSGGNPDILPRLKALQPAPAVDPRLLAGVYAYATGNQAEATANLMDLALSDLPASMAASVALTQSALAVRTDPKRSIALLSMARLLAPGTLVEEAAIRREIFVADQMKDFALVQSLARQYLDRFRHSIYAGNFRIRFASALSRMDFIDKADQYSRLDDMLAQVEPESRRQLYLTIAISTVLHSQFVAARISAERALALSEPGSQEAARAHLYRAAALAPDPRGFDDAARDLAAADRKVLPSSDQALYDVVSVTLAGVASGTDRAAMPKTILADVPRKDDLLSRAGDALKAVDDMLKVAQK